MRDRALGVLERTGLRASGYVATLIAMVWSLANVLWFLGATTQAIALVRLFVILRREWRERWSDEQLAPRLEAALQRLQSWGTKPQTCEIEIADEIAITSTVSGDVSVITPGDLNSEVSALQTRLTAVEKISTANHAETQRVLVELRAAVASQSAAVDSDRRNTVRDNLVGTGAAVLIGAVIQVVAALCAIFGW
jgi:hypothetical protein